MKFLYRKIKNFFLMFRYTKYKIKNSYIIQRLFYVNKFDVLSFFHKRKVFIKNKKPNNELYEYKIYDPYRVLKEPKGYDKLYLVGKNWEHSNKPIALMVGFNDWKFGFVADYLPEYRTVFMARKNISFLSLNPKPDLIIVWGYTESFNIKLYKLFHNIPLYRMEDGFIRSSLLGASHATPYSLILDKKGLYYNNSKESELEYLLNNYDFSKNSNLIQNANLAIDILVKLELSKYNLPKETNNSNLNIKTKKRVAVLGQVDGDAAIKYGNPDNWTSEELVKLARYENQDAEVIYRPHPEVYKGYQKSYFKKKNIEYFAKVVSPEESIVDFLETVDHVYVINSLSGLEALIRGKKVTVVGSAFYAGWGLTDDRCKIKRRNRKLSLEELFSIIYLVYPRYLANLDNNIEGFLATCFKIDADRYIETFKLKKNYIEQDYKKLINSSYWPLLFLNKDILTQGDEKKILSSSEFKKEFENNSSNIYQIILLYFISSSLSSDDLRDFFIKKVRVYIDKNIFNDFLLDMIEFYPGEYIYKHIAWLLDQEGDYNIATDILKEHIENNKKQNSELSICLKDDRLSLCNELDINIETEINIKNLWDSLNYYKENVEYENFTDTLKKIIIYSGLDTMLLNRAAEMATIKMDSNGVIQITNLLKRVNLFAHNRTAVHLELESFDYKKDEKSKFLAIRQYTLQLSMNPDRINRSWARLKSYFVTDEYYQLFKSISKLYFKKDLHLVNRDLEINDIYKALEDIEDIIEKGEKNTKIEVDYSKILFTLRRYQQAENIIKNSIKNNADHANYTEYLRQLKALGEFEKALTIAKEALNKKIPLTYEGHIMPIYFGLGKIEDGFKCFHETALKEKLTRIYKDKYRDTHSLENIDNLLLIFSSGPAEELRFSSIYNEISNAIGVDKFKITCDYRLEPILKRTFPNVSFVPVRRTRFFTSDYPIENYNKLPSSELCIALDNDAISYIEDANEIKLITELFYHFRKKYEDFPKYKNGYLKVDNKRIKYFKSKLPKNKILIGISWRSTLVNAMRNIHYLNIEDMESIFKIEGVTFVNLQYDECQHELNKIKELYNIDIINFSELDQMNDFDGVAALMKNLDLVISPFTAVIELAGAIGVNGILFSNHGESFWRKTENNKDIWYDNIKIVGEGKIGDKTSLVKGIEKEIKKFISKKWFLLKKCG